MRYQVQVNTTRSGFVPVSAFMCFADAIQNLKANDVSAGQEWIIHDLETGKSYTYDDVASMTDGQLDARSNRDCERFELANGPYVDHTALAA